MNGALPAEDRLDILDVVTRADQAAGLRDVDAYLALFTEDAALRGDMGEQQGQAALRPALAAVWAGEGSPKLHLTCNAVVDAVSGEPDRAVAHSVLLLVEAGGGPAIVSTAHVEQELHRTEHGWKVAVRTVTLDPGSRPHPPPSP